MLRLHFWSNINDDDGGTCSSTPDDDDDVDRAVAIRRAQWLSSGSVHSLAASFFKLKRIHLIASGQEKQQQQVQESLEVREKALRCEIRSLTVP